MNQTARFGWMGSVNNLYSPHENCLQSGFEQRLRGYCEGNRLYPG